MTRILKRTLLFLLLTALTLGIGSFAYVRSMDLAAQPQADRAADASTIGYQNPLPQPHRGRILTVVSSAEKLLDGSKTGFELSELSRAWWVFRANGYAVDIASPAGGEPPMRIDDVGNADYAFLNQPEVQRQLKNTLPLREVNADNYAAVYFVGGKGTMLDFYRNPDIANLLRRLAPRAVIAAVCHGPAALLDVRLDNGELLLAGHTVSAFSNAEELFLMEEPVRKLGFFLQTALQQQATYSEGPMYLDHVVVSDRLVTGQNPWSTWSVAQATIRALGHTPAARTLTAEERSVELLGIHHAQGLRAALKAKNALTADNPHAFDKRLVLMHALVAAMQWQPIRALALVRLAH